MSSPLRNTYCLYFALTLWSVLALSPSLKAADPTSPEEPGKVLATVDGHSITQADLAFATLSRGISSAPPAARKQLLEGLINQRLIKTFLDQQKVTVPPQVLDESVLKVEKLIRRKGDDPEQILSKMGYTFEKLREAIALPLAWNIYCRREITPAAMQKYFNSHREELDGTRVEASHILLKLSPDAAPADIKSATEKLSQIRSEIQSGKLTFAEAAEKYSEAPSKMEGGKLVTSAYRGKMPLALTQRVFPLQPGEISEPFQTPFGVHLITLNKKHPGQFSLEDVRGEIYQILSRQLYDQTIKQLRSQAKIEWKSDSVQ